jgi:hypothetical protein
MAEVRRPVAAATSPMDKDAFASAAAPTLFEFTLDFKLT